MPDARITVSELGRRLDRIEEDLKVGVAGLYRRLDDLNYIHPETFALQMQLEHAHREDLANTVAELKAENNDRKREAAANRRMIWTALIFPIVTAVAVALLMQAMR